MQLYHQLHPEPGQSKCKSGTFQDTKANAGLIGLIKYAQESFIQDDSLWILVNKEEGTPKNKKMIDPNPPCCLHYRNVQHQINKYILTSLDHSKTSDKGKKMVLCMTDAFTKYVELVTLADKEAETTDEAIFTGWSANMERHLRLYQTIEKKSETN